jgi:hypothetical protein
VDAEVIKIERHQNTGNVTWVVMLNNLVYNFLIFDYKKIASQIHIPKFVWHRVIKGPAQLVVEIEEL